MEKDSLFEIKTIEQIRTSLPRSKNKYGIPKSVSFVFQKLYKDIVTSIITTEITADYILYGMQEAYQENKEFSDISYWVQGTSDNEISEDIVTSIITTEITADYILYGMQEAYQENKEFSDISYWVQGTSDNEISVWWIFGADGQGDLWLFDTQGKVFFYDHDKECMCEENFKCMEIDFLQWLQLAFLFRQYEKSNRYTNEDKAKLKNELSKINENLIDNLPFDYELCI